MDVFSGGQRPEKLKPSRPAPGSLLTVLERIPALIWTTDLDSRITGLAGAALGALGVSAEECAGKPIEVLFPCLDSNRRPIEAHRMAFGGQSSSFQAAFGGRELEAHVEPLLGAGGQVIGAIGVALDGADRAVAERALRLSEQSYRLLIEEAPYAICRATSSGQLLQVNRAMMEMLGYQAESEADLLERDLPLIFSAPAAFEELRGKLVDGDTVQGLETTWLGRTGIAIQVRVRRPRGPRLGREAPLPGHPFREYYRAKTPRGAAQPGPKNAGRRSTGGRRGARFQQPADGDRRADRNGAGPAVGGRSPAAPGGCAAGRGTGRARSPGSCWPSAAARCCRARSWTLTR